MAMPILGEPQAVVEQAIAWAQSRGASEYFISAAPVYWEIAPMYGVRPEIAYTQSGKETKFGNFGGVLDASFNNFCGLKKAQGGGNYDPNAHMRFPDVQTGVLAHVQHLALYAGAQEIPNVNLYDPRHFEYLRGTAPNVEDLVRWSSSPDYGFLVADLVVQLMQTPAPPKPQPTPAPVSQQVIFNQTLYVMSNLESVIIDGKGYVRVTEVAKLLGGKAVFDNESGDIIIQF